jgi:hypothetical protein
MSEADPVALKRAQAICIAVSKYGGSTEVDSHTLGSVVKLAYTNPQLQLEDARWIYQIIKTLGEECFVLWARARQRKKIPFDLCELPSTNEEVTKEFRALNDYFSLGGKLPNRKTPHLLGGRGEYYIRQKGRWALQRASVEELTLLLQADKVKLDDLKGIQGTEVLYAFVCDLDTQKMGYSTVRIAASKREAMKCIGEE